MKFLQDTAYAAMRHASDSWNGLVSGIISANADMKPEEVTPEVVIEAMSHDGAVDQTDLASQLSSAQAELATQKTENATLTAQLATANAQIAELKGTPPQENPAVQTGKENTATESDIKDFATKNAGNTAAIMAEVKRTNFI